MVRERDAGVGWIWRLLSVVGSKRDGKGEGVGMGRQE